MAFSDKLKQLFGLGTPPADEPARVSQTSEPANQPRPSVPAESPALPSTASTPKPPPAPQRRDELFRFLIEKLTPYANETDNAPLGLRLWVRCPTPEEVQLMQVVLYANQPGRFQEELSRHLANHYIALAPNWLFEWQLVTDELPADCTYRQGRYGLTIVFKPVATAANPTQVRLRALTGQTAAETYLLDPAQKLSYCIGRGELVETASGRMRTNDIVFVDADDPRFDPVRGDANLVVSRQHATIKFDEATRRYRLYVDPGGLPTNGNKTKLLHADDTIERADMPGMGYLLTSGDQIELGGEAKLLVE